MEVLRVSIDFQAVVLDEPITRGWGSVEATNAASNFAAMSSCDPNVRQIFVSSIVDVFGPEKFDGETADESTRDHSL